MNVITTPIAAQNGPLSTIAPQDEANTFAAVLDEKFAAAQPASSVDGYSPEFAAAQPDNAMALEEALSEQQSAMERTAVPVLPQLMIQVDKVAQALAPDAVAEADGEAEDEGLPLAMVQNRSGQRDGGVTLTTTAANGPTAAAQASLPMEVAEKRDNPQGAQTPEYLLQSADAVNSRITAVSSTPEMSANVPSIQEGPTLPLAHASLSTPPLTPSTQTAQTVAAPVPTATISQEMGTEAWRQSLNQQISLYSRNGIQNAEIRLNPQELGVIRINMQLNSDQATLHFVSENHQVRAALEAAMPQLRTSLAESGIQLGESSVGAESSSSWEDHAQAGHYAAHGASEEGNGDISADQADAEAHVLQRSIRPHGINTFA